MSRTTVRKEAGITPRHARSCSTRTGGRCDCSPSYQAQAWDARAGKRLTKTFPTITAARQWRQDAGSAIRAGTLSGDRGPRLDEAADEFLAAMRAGTALTPNGHAYKPSVIRGYQSSLNQHVLPSFGTARLGDIRPIDLQRWIDRLAADLAGTSVSRALMPLRSIYRRAVRTGVVTTNPTRGLSLPARGGRRERFATPAEGEAAIAVLGMPERALWATALYAGLRAGELAALRWEDVDLARGVIHVRRGWDPVAGEIETKSRRRRRVAIPGELRDYLLDQRAHVEQRLIVMPGTGQPRARQIIARRREVHELRAGGLTIQQVADRLGIPFHAVANDLYRPIPDHPQANQPPEPHERVFTRDERLRTISVRGQKTIVAAGLEPLGLHECRHSYASFLIAAGANAKAISSMLGHASITITFDRYGHLMPGAEDEVAALLDRYLQHARDNGPDMAQEFPELAVADE